MGKALYERYSGTVLEYSEEPTSGNKHCLGHLSGIGAEFRKPTRNGRRYPLKLWQNVIASEDFKEGMETHTLFAENDHPEDRCDTSIKFVSAVLTDMRIDEQNGTVIVEFDILPTPQGRILKSLIDYGCKIGVSSRGIGDEIVQDGETIIDPDTYVYYGHDMVVTPSVKRARPDVTESINTTDDSSNVLSLFESLNREIANATTAAEVVSIKGIVESANINNDSVNESINNKLSELMAANDIGAKSSDSDSSESTRNEMAMKSRISKLELDNKRLSEKLDANNIRLSEAKKTLKETLKTSSSLSKLLQDSKRSVAKLQLAAYESAEQASDYENKIRALENELEDKTDKLMSENKKLAQANRLYSRRNSELRTKLDEAIESMDKARSDSLRSTRQLNESRSEAKRYESRISDYSDRMSKLEEANKRLITENDKLRLTVSRLEESCSEYESRLSTVSSDNDKLSEELEKVHKSATLTESKARSQNNKLANEVSNVRKTYKKAVDEYLKMRCSQSGLSLSTVRSLLPENFTVEEINSVVNELSDRNDRLSKLPINVPARRAIVAESIGPASTEDRQTMAILSGTVK